jgi:hypothetical protein
MKKFSMSKLIFVVPILLLLSACASRVPILLDDGFKQKQPESIVLMPVVDARKDPSSKVDMEGDILKPTKVALEKKGYSVTVSRDFSNSRTITPQEVATMRLSDLSQLGPAEAPFLLFLYLEDLEYTYAVIYKNIKIGLSGVIVQKEPEKYVWRDKQTTQTADVGLLSGLTVSQSATFQNTLRMMLSSLPKRTKAK